MLIIKTSKSASKLPEVEFHALLSRRPGRRIEGCCRGKSKKHAFNLKKGHDAPHLGIPGHDKAGRARQFHREAKRGVADGGS